MKTQINKRSLQLEFAGLQMLFNKIEKALLNVTIIYNIKVEYRQELLESFVKGTNTYCVTQDSLDNLTDLKKELPGKFDFNETHLTIFRENGSFNLPIERFFEMRKKILNSYKPANLEYAEKTEKRIKKHNKLNSKFNNFDATLVAKPREIGEFGEWLKVRNFNFFEMYFGEQIQFISDKRLEILSEYKKEFEATKEVKKEVVNEVIEIETPKTAKRAYRVQKTKYMPVKWHLMSFEQFCKEYSCSSFVNFESEHYNYCLDAFLNGETVLNENIENYELLKMAA